MKTPKLIRAVRRYRSINKSIQMWKPNNNTSEGQKPHVQRHTSHLSSVTSLHIQENSLSTNTSSENVYEEIPSFAVRSKDVLQFTPISKVAKTLKNQNHPGGIKDHTFLSQFSPIVSTGSTNKSIVNKTSLLQISDYDGNQNVLQDYRGQIKVKIHISNNELIVDICQAKDLSSMNCDSFVEVSLIDEQSEMLSCNTSVVYQSQNPVYDEKFTYSLLKEDYRKRILVSVWNFEEASKEGVFVGCMSFGIENIAIKQNTVSGWFYLLEENMGERKHMQVKGEQQVHNDYEIPISIYYNYVQIARENGSLNSTTLSVNSHCDSFPR